MIGLLAVLAFGMELTEEPTRVWVTGPVTALRYDARACALEPVPVEIPVGMVGKASIVRTEGCEVEFVELVVPSLEYAGKGQVYAITGEGLSAEAPRKPWKGAEPLREGVVARGLNWTTVVQLDEPDAPTVQMMLGGERVTLLQEPTEKVYATYPNGGSGISHDMPSIAVVRTADGRVLAVDGEAFHDDDPLLDWEQDDRRRHLDLYTAGLARRGSPVWPAPPAEDLAADPSAHRGRIYHLSTGKVVEQVFGDAFVEPVGLVVDAPCETSWRGCGRYYLDVSAFGGWRPDGNVGVIAVADGMHEGLPRLDVLVVDPWGDALRVSTSW